MLDQVLQRDKKLPIQINLNYLSQFNFVLPPIKDHINIIDNP